MKGSANGSLTGGVTQRWPEASLVKDRQVNSGGDATTTCTKVPSRYWRIASGTNRKSRNKDSDHFSLGNDRK